MGVMIAPESLPSARNALGKFDARKDLRYHVCAGWSSLVARWAHNPKVEGSNPSPATNFFNWLRIPPALLPLQLLTDC